MHMIFDDPGQMGALAQVGRSIGEMIHDEIETGDDNPGRPIVELPVNLVGKIERDPCVSRPAERGHRHPETFVGVERTVREFR
jgi:hypothetical protein